MAKPKKHTREDFDLAWHNWRNEPDGPKKQRLLNVIVKDNYALVQKFVNRLMKRSAVHCDEDDAMQAGLIGLLTAIRKYDPARPTRFSTMCWPWVRHEVSNMMTRQTQLYRPKGTGMPYKEHRECESVEARTGREATAEDLNVPQVKLDKWKSVIFHFVPMNEVKEHASEDTFGPYRQSDALRDPAADADDQLIEHETNRRVAKAIKKLSTIEYKILIDGDRSMPASVSDAIKANAIAKVRKFLQEV